MSDGGRVERGLGRSQELAAVDRPRITFVKTGRDSLITADDLRSKDSNVTGEDITSQRDMNIELSYSGDLQPEEMMISRANDHRG